ncbi:unnamed protein product [Rotaria socialis]|uniref:Uncharacterized protein n=1 Tax=Rotaria socialis TaxID=392032 RepID=A0A821EMN0_9BILA|nr:unnamed protein product [Rotaria socialis]
MAPNNIKEAEEAVIKEDQWNYHYTNTTGAGRKTFFQCNKANRSKRIVQELFELKLKLKAIIEMLHERASTVPSIHQLNSFLRTVKSTELGSTSISLGSNLFVKKWPKKEPNFIEYFQNEWLTTHNAWHEGVGHFTPRTNNTLEATNNVIKKKGKYTS